MQTSFRPSSPWPIVIILAAVLVFFGPIVTHDFTLWDDNSTISQNGRINHPSLENTAYYWTHQFGSLYIPITYTVWAILAVPSQLGVADSSGIHLNPMLFAAANVVMHAGGALVVLSILTRLTRNRTAALIGALLFAVHPVQVEPVAWISGLKDVLWGFFALLAIDQYIAFAQSDSASSSTVRPASASSDLSSESPAVGRSKRRLLYIGATLCYALAMLSKPSAMVTPLLVIAIDRLLLVRSWRQIARSIALWFVLAVPIAIIARLVQTGHETDGGPLWARPLIALDSLAFYVGKLLWPATLTPDYGHNPLSVMASGELWWTWLVPASLAGIALWQLRRRPWIAAGALVFLFATLPTLGLTPYAFEFFSTTADHYLYVSMLGVGLLAAFAISEIPAPKRPAWLGVCAVLLAVLGVRSCLQTQYWADSHTLFTHMVDARPNGFTGYTLLGQMDVDAGDYAAAEPLLRRAIAIEPKFPKTHDALATVLIHTGRTDEAIEHIKIFIESASDALPAIRANLADSHMTLGLYYFKHGDHKQAADEFRAALKYRPDDKTLQNLLKQAEG